VQSAGDRIGGGGGTVALSAAEHDESGVRRDDLGPLCQSSEGGENDSENRILGQPFMDDKNREKNKDTSESEGSEYFSYVLLFSIILGVFHNFIISTWWHDLYENLWYCDISCPSS
jgi:hypothetical protein